MREELEDYSSSGDRSDVATKKRNTLIKTISKRLRPICSKMSSAEFDAMVGEMADIELKYADRTTPSNPGDRAD